MATDRAFKPWSSAKAFLCNLFLLGFDPREHARGIFNHVVVDEHMFRHANNNKAFEMTSHFLFHKLDPIRTRLRFQNCWPITDYSRQAREYRAIAYRWLEDLRKSLPGQIVLRKSYFEDCRGERMDAIMLSFSTYVLQTVLERDYDTLFPHILGDSPIRLIDKTLTKAMSTEQLRTTLTSEITRLSESIVATKHLPLDGSCKWLAGAEMIVKQFDPHGARWSNWVAISDKKGKLGGKSSSFIPLDLSKLKHDLQKRLDHLNQENKRLSKLAAQKEGAFASQRAAKDVSEDMFVKLLNAAKEPAEYDPTFVLPPLYETPPSTAERVATVKEYIDKCVAERLEKDTLEKSQEDDQIVETIKGRSPAKRSQSPVLPMTPVRIPKRRRISRSPAPATVPASPSSSHVSSRRTSYQVSSPYQSPHRRTPTISKSPVEPRRIPTPSRRISQNSFPSDLSSHVSPISGNYPDYCDHVVNTVLDNFHDERTPTARLPSSVHSSSNGRYSPRGRGIESINASPIAPGQRARNLDDDTFWHNSRDSVMNLPNVRQSLGMRSPTAEELDYVYRSPSHRHSRASSATPSLIAYHAAVDTSTSHYDRIFDESEPELYLSDGTPYR